MPVSSVSSSSNTALIQWLASQSTQQTNSQSNPLTSLLSSADTNGSVSISHLSKFLSRLDDLAKSDPEKFKAMMSDIASKLSAAADNETGEAASALSKLAEQFRSAAETGTTDPLREASSSSDDSGSYAQSGAAADLTSLLRLFASGTTDVSLTGQLDDLLQSVLSKRS
jgi:hypothetical protein